MPKNNDPLLTHVSFKGTGFAGFAQGVLIESLPSNSHLIALDLSDCALVENTFNDFVDSIMQNQSLKYLNITGTCVQAHLLEPLQAYCDSKGIKFIHDSSLAKPMIRK